MKQSFVEVSVAKTRIAEWGNKDNPNGWMIFVLF